MSAAIRVKNLYFMLLYAWDLFPGGQASDLLRDEAPDEVNLFATILAGGVKRLLRRGLARGYIELYEETSAPRGRFHISETLSKATLSNGRAVCSYTELTVDTPLNRVLKATMRSLADVQELSPDTAHELRVLCRRLADIGDVRFGYQMFRGVQLSGNSRDYLLLLRLCELIVGRLMPGEGVGQKKFLEVLEDEVTMSQVFESFLRAFYRIEQSKFKISAAHVPWKIEAERTQDLEYMPTMRTDITLLSKEETIIIDAKYYKSILRSYRGASPKLRSEHLYQIQSYMKHSRDQRDAPVSGVLLYAATGEGGIHLRYKLDGLPVQIVALDLDRPWAAIADEALGLVGVPSRYRARPHSSSKAA